MNTTRTTQGARGPERVQTTKEWVGRIHQRKRAQKEDLQCANSDRM